jgi:hypothetical protein
MNHLTKKIIFKFLNKSNNQKYNNKYISGLKNKFHVVMCADNWTKMN